MFACVMIRAARKAPQDYATAEALLDALTPYGQDDVRGQWSDENMLMVQALTWNTPQSRHEAAPEVCKKTGRVIVSWVRLDNRPELCAALGSQDSETLTDPQIILECHDKWGADCANRLEGDFSFVIYDPATNQAFCARDSIGAKPFYYYADATVFVAASTAAVFPILKTLAIKPSRRWIAEYMVEAPHDMATSAFEDVMRLAPAHSLLVPKQGVATAHEYFKFQDLAPQADTRDPKYVDDYRAAFHRATEARLRSDFPVGAESSGGLDSSSIVGHAVHHLPHDIDDFHCFGLCAHNDEPEYLLETSQHCGVRHNHITTHGQLYEDADTLTRMIRVMGHPVEHRQIQWHSAILRQCEQFGVRTLLSGYGGDELVTHQAMLLNRELFNNSQFSALASEMPGSWVTRRVRYLVNLRRLTRKVAQIGAPIDASKFGPLLDNSLLQRSLIDEFDLKDSFTSGFQHQSEARSLNEHMLRAPNFSPRRVARLEGGALIAQSHGVEYRWPLFDRKLMVQYLETPAIEKRHQRMGRYLHRRAVVGTIPDKITWKQGKEMGGFAIGLTGRELPLLLSKDDAPQLLWDVIDFDQLKISRDAFVNAKASNDFGVLPFMHMNSLWRASLLAQWLQ